MNFYLALFKDILGQRSFEIILKYFPPQFGSQKSWLTLEIKIKIMAKLSLNWQLKNIFLKLSFKLPQKQNLFIFIEVRSSTFEVRVRLEFSPISSRCSKFGHAKVRVFEVRNFWVRSNTNPPQNWSQFFLCMLLLLHTTIVVVVGQIMTGRRLLESPVPSFSVLGCSVLPLASSI